jgi:hypothetical protein
MPNSPTEKNHGINVGVKEWIYVLLWLNISIILFTICRAFWWHDFKILKPLTKINKELFSYVTSYRIWYLPFLQSWLLG